MSILIFCQEVEKTQKDHIKKNKNKTTTTKRKKQNKRKEKQKQQSKQIKWTEI